MRRLIWAYVLTEENLRMATPYRVALSSTLRSTILTIDRNLPTYKR